MDQSVGHQASSSATMLGPSRREGTSFSLKNPAVSDSRPAVKGMGPVERYS